MCTEDPALGRVATIQRAIPSSVFGGLALAGGLTLANFLRFLLPAPPEDSCAVQATSPDARPPIAGSGAYVLVTGGAGFLGAHVARECLALGMRVTVVDDLSGGSARNLPAGAAFVRGDLRDAAFVDGLFRNRTTATRFKYVYHLAAYAAEGLSHFIRSYNYRTNLVASALLVNAAIKFGVRCFVFTSSIAVYGTGQLPLSERAALAPEDPYGIGKLAMELDLAAAGRQFGLEWVVFRPHNVYGPLQNAADRYRNVLGIFLSQLRAAAPLTIFGDGAQTRSFTYVDDVAQPIARAPLHPQLYRQIFNVGADEQTTLNELAALLSQAWGAPLHVTRLPPRNEVRHARATHHKLRCFLGAHAVAPTPLREGIARTVAWALEQLPPTTEDVARGFGAVEVLRGLPPSWRDAGLREVPEYVGARVRNVV